MTDTTTAPRLIVTVSDASMLTKLKEAIRQLKGVSAISVQNPKKARIELAREDMEKGQITAWDTVDGMLDNVLRT